MRCKEVNAKNLAKMVIDAPISMKFDFAERYENRHFKSIHGISRINIFDEYGFGLIAIGYWGGGKTRILDISKYYDNDREQVENIVVAFIQKYFNEEIKQDEVLLIDESSEIQVA
jgi:hypothetical protein